MKQLFRSIVISLLMLASFGAAAEGNMMGHGMGMMGGMSEAEQDQHLKMMQEHMLAVQDLGNQILAEKDPAKKEALKTKQLELLKAHHAQMMGMMHGGMKHEMKK